PARNAIADANVPLTAPSPVFHLATVDPAQRGKPMKIDAGLPVKGGDAWTLNMFVRTDKQPEDRTVIAGFGVCGGKADGSARYICKFDNGIHFWSHHSDL